MFVLCDEVYRDLIYTDDLHELHPRCRRCATASSRSRAFAKPYAMTGWRAGYLLADAPVKAAAGKGASVQCGLHLQRLVQQALRAGPAIRHQRRPRAEPPAAGLRLRPAGQNGAPLPQKPQGAFSMCSPPSPGIWAWTPSLSHPHGARGQRWRCTPGSCFRAEGYVGAFPVIATATASCPTAWIVLKGNSLKTL